MIEFVLSEKEKELLCKALLLHKNTSFAREDKEFIDKIFWKVFRTLEFKKVVK